MARCRVVITIETVRGDGRRGNAIRRSTVTVAKSVEVAKRLHDEFLAMATARMDDLNEEGKEEE